MRRCRIQRSKARGWGVGRWHHRFGKYVDLLSTCKREGCVFRFFHSETHFQKSVFSGAAFSGSECKVGQNGAIHLRFRKRAFSCGRPLRITRQCWRVIKLPHQISFVKCQNSFEKKKKNVKRAWWVFAHLYETEFHKPFLENALLL